MLLKSLSQSFLNYSSNNSLNDLNSSSTLEGVNKSESLIPPSNDSQSVIVKSNKSKAIRLNFTRPFYF